MAAIFCLFSVALCKLANQTFPQQETNSLSASQNVINSNHIYFSRLCSQHFRYIFNEVDQEWQALAAFPSLRIGRTIKIVIKFSFRAELSTVSQFKLQVRTDLYADNLPGCTLITKPQKTQNSK